MIFDWVRLDSTCIRIRERGRAGNWPHYSSTPQACLHPPINNHRSPATSPDTTARNPPSASRTSLFSFLPAASLIDLPVQRPPLPNPLLFRLKEQLHITTNQLPSFGLFARSLFLSFTTLFNSYASTSVRSHAFRFAVITPLFLSCA